jgi:2-methylfumaryl-CoA hydratase
MRPAGGYFFEDYAIGQKFSHAVPRTLTAGDTALYQALTGSRNPLHCSEPFAQSLGFSATPVDDLLVFHIAFGKTVPDISYNAVANLGYAECRFLKPVYLGDTLCAETEIVGLKGNSNGKTGVVYVRSTCRNQRDEPVLTWVRWVMVHRRAAVPAGEHAAQGRTDFAATVPAAQLAEPIGGPVQAADIERATGCGLFWDDIAVGGPAAQSRNANIVHPAGMTIDESDHTLATKLYQNTARVHFDALHMKGSRFGQRLIYGGHIISLCRALSFDGLGNALTILAINAGSHLSPTLAGDTIYSTHLPLSKWPVNAGWGAVRLAMLGFKNLDPASADFNDKADAHKVLSLDYTVLTPRRSA